MKKIFFILSLVFSVALLFSSGCSGNKASSIAKGEVLLSDFGNAKVWDISPERGFNLSLSKEHVTEGRHSLKVVYPISTWPSINTKKLLHNWGNYEYFCFDVFSPQNEQIDFVIRLDDDRKKRVNINYPLQNGWNYVKIAKERIASKINANDISFVVLFLNNPNQRITLYFDNMRLVKKQIDRAQMSATEENFERTQREDKKYYSKKRKETVIKEVFRPFSVKSRLPLEGVLRVSVANLSEPKKKRVLTSSSVPFAPGQLFAERNFAVFDKTGKEIPIAVKVLARWPYDDSIRSLLVQFPLEIEHKYKQVLIQWGKPRNTQDINFTEVKWILPEGYIILPAKWLCLSQIIGEQVPFGEHPFPKYDHNIEKYYPRIRDVSWTGNIIKDSYYDTPHVFYQLYVRSGDVEYFKSARREAVHYRDELIIQEGPERGRNITYKKHRYIYVQAMVDDYLLTGDTKSLAVAGYMAEYLKNNFDPSKAFFPKNGRYFWTERLIAFPFLGIVSYYEITQKKEYLEIARKIMQNLYKTQNEWVEKGGFTHNLYYHDPEEGARIGEYGGSPFMTGLLLEAIIKYHKLTNSNIAKDSIFKAVDWLIEEGLAPDKKSVVYLTSDRHRYTGHPDLNLPVAHAFGYGYKISGYNRRDYLEVGKRIFREGVNKAYLKDRKHFNQNYRSSGHFLSYIAEVSTKKHKL